MSGEADTQALEEILIGHRMAIAGEADQIFRAVAMFGRGSGGDEERGAHPPSGAVFRALAENRIAREWAEFP